MTSPHKKSREAVEKRRVRVDNIRVFPPHNFVKASAQPSNQSKFSDPRRRRQPVTRRAVKAPPVDILDHVAVACRHIVLRRGELQGLPTTLPLRPEYPERARHITTLQWQSVIKNVEDTHQIIYAVPQPNEQPLKVAIGVAQVKR
jgi:hypothetical protein